MYTVHCIGVHTVVILIPQGFLLGTLSLNTKIRHDFVNLDLSTYISLKMLFRLCKYVYYFYQCHSIDLNKLCLRHHSIIF